jgi:hypothetical protein
LKLKEFEHYAKLWIPLVEKFGGNHHGYFMPHEGANDIALALFSFSVTMMRILALWGCWPENPLARARILSRSG